MTPAQLTAAYPQATRSPAWAPQAEVYTMPGMAAGQATEVRFHFTDHRLGFVLVDFPGDHNDPPSVGIAHAKTLQTTLATKYGQPIACSEGQGGEPSYTCGWTKDGTAVELRFVYRGQGVVPSSLGVIYRAADASGL